MIEKAESLREKKKKEKGKKIRARTARRRGWGTEEVPPAASPRHPLVSCPARKASREQRKINQRSPRRRRGLLTPHTPHPTRPRPSGPGVEAPRRGRSKRAAGSRSPPPLLPSDSFFSAQCLGVQQSCGGHLRILWSYQLGPYLLVPL
ncbi:hypothetical protein ZWY2020_013895 [Hordeum vulgare]|nr:hypothetical protein ZWY2020_013895 [Hordeum vulgare]